MKITKLGLSWGAAYEEAQPIKVSHGTQEIEIFVSEAGQLKIKIADDINIKRTSSAVIITLDS